MCQVINCQPSATDKITFHTIMQRAYDECRRFLEQMRWGDSPRCPKCGAENPYRITRKTPSKNKTRKPFKCRRGKRQFTATVGTIFEHTTIPLSKWFAAIYLMCSSKKGISEHQLRRNLDNTYRSAWSKCHRVRNAMQDYLTESQFGQTVSRASEICFDLLIPSTRVNSQTQTRDHCKTPVIPAGAGASADGTSIQNQQSTPFHPIPATTSVPFARRRCTNP